MLLTRLPLSTHRSVLLVRLACVRPAASIRSEPGSNSQVQILKTTLDFNITKLTRVWFVKDKQVLRYIPNISNHPTEVEKPSMPGEITPPPAYLFQYSTMSKIYATPTKTAQETSWRRAKCRSNRFFVEQTSNITPEVLAASIRCISAPEEVRLIWPWFGTVNTDLKENLQNLCRQI